MEISPILLAKLLLYSFFWGIATGILYDACRILRVLCGAMDVRMPKGKSISLKIPTVNRYISSERGKESRGFFKNVTIFFTDLASILAASVGLVVLNYGYNDGRFRFFTVIGALLGFLLYYFTLGKLTVGVLAPITFFIKYAFFSLFAILWSPFRFFAKIVIKNVRKTYFLCQIAIEKRRKKEYNIYEKVLLLELSKNGFIGDLFADEREASSNKKQEV